MYPNLYRIVGFLFGFSLASSYAAYHLLDEYKLASAALQASVEELKLSTEQVQCFLQSPQISFATQVSTHIRRIEAVEKDLKALSSASATKEDITRIRAEAKKLYDGLHVGPWHIYTFFLVLISVRTFGLANARVGYA